MDFVLIDHKTFLWNLEGKTRSLLTSITIIINWSINYGTIDQITYVFTILIILYFYDKILSKQNDLPLNVIFSKLIKSNIVSYKSFSS